MSPASVRAPTAALLLLALSFGARAGAQPAGALPSAASPSAAAPWTAALAERVRGIDLAHRGALQVWVQDVASGESYGYDAEAPAYLSSTLKLVVALAVLREVDAGALSLDEPLRLEAQDVRDGVGLLGPADVGTERSVGQLLELMLVRSDNTAADRLITRVGEDRLDSEVACRGLHFGPLRSLLTERQQLYARLDPRGAHLSGAQLRELGRHESLDARARAFAQLVGAPPPQDATVLPRAFEAFYATGVNTAPLREVGGLLAQVARCEGLSAGSCARMQTLMRACRTGAARVRAGLPAQVAWAHKTGTQFQRACDVGFFTLAPGRSVVVAACARDFDQVPEAEAAFREVGAAVWSALGAQPPPPVEARRAPVRAAPSP
ncbi:MULTISPECIES: serine hydrolase [Myxococcaceae]|uniref:serine hydrolase n=1 Tax=Myxococcaceae TaxID=31 RepID=UPI00188EB41D|nr:serine hydrolase [Simulacricoccus sp. 17bor-14]